MPSLPVRTAARLSADRQQQQQQSITRATDIRPTVLQRVDPQVKSFLTQRYTVDAPNLEGDPSGE